MVLKDSMFAAKNRRDAMEWFNDKDFEGLVLMRKWVKLGRNHGRLSVRSIANNASRFRYFAIDREGDITCADSLNKLLDKLWGWLMAGEYAEEVVYKLDMMTGELTLGAYNNDE